MNSDSDISDFNSRLRELRHDIRTPIGHIIGYSELIEENLDATALKACGHDLQAIQNAGQKMLALIDQYFGNDKNSSDEIEFDDAQFHLRMQLNHIAGYAEMLREDALDDGRNEMLGDLDHISEAQVKALQMLETLGRRLFETKATTMLKSAKHNIKTNVSKDTSAPSLAGIGGEILVVDDDPGNRELLARRLARGGYTSVTVDSGEEALVCLDKRRFDLVLLDQIMPGKSGLEILQIMQASPRLRTIPVIMLSAADNPELMVQCVLSGAEDYVSKPFNPVLFIARINACLEKVRLRQNTARNLKVFISSPGDVIPERQIVKKVIGHLNEEFNGRAYLVPILWEEEPLLASDTFQAQIHPPRNTDIYVGILWSRIGSPLPEKILRPDGTIYDSGTAFEFEDALHGFHQNGHPEMLLYRKNGSPTVSLEDKDIVLDRLEQIDRLQSYVDRYFIGDDGSYVAAFHTFDDDAQFETIIETHLRKLVERILSGGQSSKAKIKQNPGKGPSRIQKIKKKAPEGYHDSTFTS